MATTKTKALTVAQKLALAKQMLKEVQRIHFHYPDSDAKEYCAGCGRSPYNVPPHDAICIVVELSETLKKL